ncbi:hypothetical protein ACP4OV_023533 [Aristida adscensionis]
MVQAPAAGRSSATAGKLIFDQKEEDAAAGNLWRKKLVLHGMRVDDFVGYSDSENPMAAPPGRAPAPSAQSITFVRRRAVAGDGEAAPAADQERDSEIILRDPR